jgi:phthalate 4,5-cis-dihydrodiol dehydrogenase
MNTPLRIGVIGLGRAFTLMLPTFQQDPRVQLVAATDPLPQACAQFDKDFQGQVAPNAETLCALPDLDLIYIASPHGLHAEHTAMAAKHGKHVWVEKPMAVDLNECHTMIQTCHSAEVKLMVGHSHSFNAPVLRAYELIQSGRLGKVKMITALNYTDFLYRPRRPEELNTALGGGVIHSQASHQVDVVRLLGGGQVSTVQACTGQWDATRPTEGAYSALLKFEGGAFANLTYNGYGHFDSDIWMDHVGEIGNHKPASESAKRYGLSTKQIGHYGQFRTRTSAQSGAQLWGSLYKAIAHNEEAYHHFGPVIVSCEKADVRLTPKGLWMYGPEQESFEALPVPAYPRKEVIDELWGALREGRPLLHSGSWARATTEVCLSLLEAAQTGQAVHLNHQVAVHHD